MKSFTRNQPNVQVLGADKRFEALKKIHESEHQHLLSNHHKEMQELRDSLSIAMEKFKSLSEKGEEELRDLKTYTLYQLAELSTRIWTNEKQLSEQKKSIEDLAKQLFDFQSLYSTKTEMDRFAKEVKESITEIVTGNINGFQDCQSQLKGLIDSLRDDLTKAKEGTEKKFSELIDQIERNYNVLKIDREGVLKEIRIWEKTIFIIEKKIENIYTLIERINNRGESCHRPE